MINCNIYTPSGKYINVETEMISFDSSDQRRGIIEGHMPTVIKVEACRFTTLNNGERKHYAMGPGVLYFDRNEAKFLVDSIERKEEIDIERANAAYERANSRIKTKRENLDLLRAELALSKALNRIKVYNYKE